jgi:hypothetical protein
MEIVIDINLKFMRDIACTHSAKDTMTWPNSNCVKLVDRPANSTNYFPTDITSVDLDNPIKRSQRNIIWRCWLIIAPVGLD